MNLQNKIKDLFDSTKKQEALDISKEKPDFLKSCLEQMLRIRITEQKLALERQKGNIGGPVHLGVGQEAIAVGISSQLNKNDMIFGAHRSHAHLLAMGSRI